jgi:hypothetical protein
VSIIGADVHVSVRLVEPEPLRWPGDLKLRCVAAKITSLESIVVFLPWGAKDEACRRVAIDVDAAVASGRIHLPAVDCDG